MDHTRHSGIFSVADWPVTLIGAGGIGAITAVVLAKMGVPDIDLYDDDYIDDVNLATQFHLVHYVGSDKVSGVAQLISLFADETIVNLFLSRVTADSGLFTNPIVISAVDDITARKGIWAALQKEKWMWYLDARMGAEVFQLYCVRKGEHDWYGQALAAIDEDSVPDEPCTAKATIYTAAMASGHIGLAVKDIATGVTPPKLQIHNIKDRVLIVP